MLIMLMETYTILLKFLPFSTAVKMQNCPVIPFPKLVS
jgi:hypothetical protein